jgi:hypothetical protein
VLSLRRPPWMPAGCVASVSVIVLSLATTSRAAHIRGRVTGPDEAPLAGAVVSAFAVFDQHWGDLEATVQTNADGTYDLGPLTPGQYHVEARGGPGHPFLLPVCYYWRTGSFTFYDHNADPYTLRAVDVSAADAGDIDIQLRTTGGAIEGRTTEADGTTPLVNLAVRLFNEEEQLTDIVRTDEEGRFGVYGVRPGRYIAEYGRWDDDCYYMNTHDGLPGPEWYNGNRAAATRIEVTASSITGDVKMRFTMGGRIAGKVTASDGVTPLAGFEVTAYDADDLRWRGNTTTRDDGTYQICSVPPGDYLVEACPPVYQTSPQFQCQVYAGIDGAVEFGCADATSAAQVPVAAGQVVSGIDFALHRPAGVSLTLLNPRPPGECFAPGDTLVVRWTGDRGPSYLSITPLDPAHDYTDGCGIDSEPADDGTFTTTISDAMKPGEYCVNATAYAPCYEIAVQTEPFCIVNDRRASLKITEPAPGQCLEAGSEQVLRWTATNLSGDVSGVLLDFGSVCTIAELGPAPAEGGEIRWRVPRNAPVGRYVVLLWSMEGHCPHVQDTVSLDCINGAMPVASLRVVSPNAGETLSIGSTHAIRWSVDAPGLHAPVQIDLYQGGLWAGRIGQADAAEGEYVWTVPPFVTPRDDCTIVIRSAFFPGCNDERPSLTEDESDGEFTIQGSPLPRPVIVITSPQYSPWLYGGTQQCVTWTVESPLDLDSLNAVVYLQQDPGPSRDLAVVPVTAGEARFTVPCGFRWWTSHMLGVRIEGDLSLFSDGAATGIVIRDVPGDSDCDADVDLADFAVFEACLNGPNRLPGGAGCDRFDFDHDGDVDLRDFLDFQTCFNGPNRPMPELCEFVGWP